MKACTLIADQVSSRVVGDPAAHPDLALRGDRGRGRASSMVIASGAPPRPGGRQGRPGRGRGDDTAAAPGGRGRPRRPARGGHRHEHRQQRRASGHAPTLGVAARARGPGCRRAGTRPDVVVTRVRPRVPAAPLPPLRMRRRPALGDRRAGPASRRSSTSSATLFAAAGHELALVGGPVRDAMLGRPAQRPRLHHLGAPRRDRAAAARLGRRGLGHGPRLRHHRLPQGSTGRSRSRRTAPSAYDPSSRKPEVDFGDTLDGDLGRRDFTVNAMAVLLPDREFVDPYGGVRRPRAPGAAHARAGPRTPSPTTRCG